MSLYMQPGCANQQVFTVRTCCVLRGNGAPGTAHTFSLCVTQSLDKISVVVRDVITV